MTINERLMTKMAEWRAKADVFRSYGHERTALLCEKHAAELDAELRAAANETLTLTEAAAESGYSADHLGRLVRDKKITNAGRPHAPGIRRGDLPRKAGRLQNQASRGTIRAVASREQIARAVVTSIRERNDG